MSETGIKGFKVFNPDWTCRDKRYSCPGKFEEDVIPSVCGEGMHFCKKAADCFNYYPFNPKNKVAEVVAYGTVAEDDDKCCTDKLEIVREIPWQEVLEIVNTGKACTGCCNGCFNTVSPKIHLFNKPSEWTYQDWLESDARCLLNQIPRNELKYICYADMTEEEKAAHPEAKTTGGYLKKLDNSECAVIWWNGLSDCQKAIITEIPNFDKAIFKEITGIDVDAD